MADITGVTQIRPVEAPLPTPDKAFEPSKPVLLRMLDVHKSLGKTGDAASHFILDRLESEKVQLQAWSKKEMDHLLEVANRTWMEHAWSTLKTVADAFVSVCNFVMGGYLLFVGDKTAGSALIAAGVFNILQSFFTNQGVWDWLTETLAEKNESYRSRLKVALPIIISALSLAFSIANSRFAANANPSKLLEHLEQAKNFISMGTQGMSSYLEIRKSWDDAKLPGLQAELKHLEQNTDLLTRFLDASIKESRRMKSMIKKPINTLMQAATLASQKV